MLLQWWSWSGSVGLKVVTYAARCDNRAGGTAGRRAGLRPAGDVRDEVARPARGRGREGRAGGRGPGARPRPVPRRQGRSRARRRTVPLPQHRQALGAARSGQGRRPHHAAVAHQRQPICSSSRSGRVGSRRSGSRPDSFATANPRLAVVRITPVRTARPVRRRSGHRPHRDGDGGLGAEPRHPRREAGADRRSAARVHDRRVRRVCRTHRGARRAHRRQARDRRPLRARSDARHAAVSDDVARVVRTSRLPDRRGALLDHARASCGAPTDGSGSTRSPASTSKTSAPCSTCPEYADRQTELSWAGEAHDEFMVAIQPWLDTHSVDEIVGLCQIFRIPAAPVGDGEKLHALRAVRRAAVLHHRARRRPRVSRARRGGSAAHRRRPVAPRPRWRTPRRPPAAFQAPRIPVPPNARRDRRRPRCRSPGSTSSTSARSGPARISRCTSARSAPTS